MADPLQDPASGAAGDGTEAPGGYEICIKVDAQGAISVGVESEADEGAEAAAPAAGAAPEAEDDAGFQPVKNIAEAISLAKTIFANQGQMPDTSSDDAQMSAGFAGKGAPAAGDMGM